MHNPRHPHVLPVRDGVSPSCVVLPARGQGSMLDFLTQRLPAVSREGWHERMEAGVVVDERGQAVLPDRAFEGGLRLYYYRSLQAGICITPCWYASNAGWGCPSFRHCTALTVIRLGW